MTRKQLRKGIHKYDIVLDKTSSDVREHQRVYIVIDIYGITGNGSIEMLVLLAGKLDNVALMSLGGAPDRFEVTEIFLENVEICGHLTAAQVKEILSTKNIDKILISEKMKSRKDELMERYEIQEIVEDKTQAKAFLETYQNFPDETVREIYGGISQKELDQITSAIKQRYNYRTGVHSIAQ